MPSVPVPQWLPARQVRRHALDFVAAFPCDFEQALRFFGARASRDANGGGAGPVQFFFLQLAAGRMAALYCWDREPSTIELYLTVREGGRVDLEDLEQVVEPLGIEAQAVFRQGGLVWRRRKPLAKRIDA